VGISLILPLRERTVNMVPLTLHGYERSSVLTIRSRGCHHQGVPSLTSVAKGSLLLTEVEDLLTARECARTGLGRQLRIAADLTHREVGCWTGVSASTVCRWEAGNRVPRGDAAVKYGHLMRSLMVRAAAVAECPAAPTSLPDLTATGAR